MNSIEKFYSFIEIIIEVLSLGELDPEMLNVEFGGRKVREGVK